MSTPSPRTSETGSFRYSSTPHDEAPPAPDNNAEALFVLGGRWLQALGFEKGASLHLQLDSARTTVFGPAATSDRSSPNPPTIEKLVRLRVRVPYALRGRFKTAARQAHMRPEAILKLLIEDFARTGRVPPQRPR